jgi:hypothetical protein
MSAEHYSSSGTSQIQSNNSVRAAYYKLIKGNNVDVCEAYKLNLNSFDNSIPMACERKYDPSIKGFSSVKWQKLDRKKYFNLYKKAEIYIEGGWKGASNDEVLQGIEGRAKYQEIELNISRLDLDNSGKLTNVLAVKDFNCGPNPSRTAAFRKTRIYILNDGLTDIDYKRQAHWENSYNNTTIELYKGYPYIEHYEPDDNWGHLFTGDGRLFVMKEQSKEAAGKEFPNGKVIGGLKPICELQYIERTLKSTR